VTSFLAKALSRQPKGELRQMLADAQEAARRAQFEVELIEEALSAAGAEKISGMAPSAASPSPASRTPREVRELVLSVVRELGPVAPKSIRNKINDESINVYNALSQLVREGKLARRDGIYELASANGSSAREPSTDAPSLGLGGMGGQTPWPQ
jgi:hypothetical protein